MKDNKDVVLAAVANHGWAIQYASKRLQEDKDVIAAALQQNQYALESLNNIEDTENE